MLCALLFLTACGRGDAGGNQQSGMSREIGAAGDTDAAGGKEWVYVPEVLWVGDERADYGDMRLIGDTLCYMQVPGEDEGSGKKICRYSMTDKALQSVDIDWQSEGDFWEKHAYALDKDCNVWLIANVYSEDYSQLMRFLCRFDSEGKLIFAREITEQLGRGISVGDMVVDRQGRLFICSSEYSDVAGIWLYTGDGSFHGFIGFDASETVFVKGTAEAEDGKFYVCYSEGQERERCILMEVDFEGCQASVLTEDMPYIDGFCSGRRLDGSLSAAGEDSGADVPGSVSMEEFGADGQGSASAELSGTDGQDSASPEQYDFLLYDHTSAYGCNISSSKSSGEPVVEELFAWADSDVNGYYVTNLGVMGDGRYFCTVEDWQYDDRCVILLNKTKAEDAPRKVHMTLAAVNEGGEQAAMVVRFNRANPQYHLAVKNYESLTDLYIAILAREPIDIIDLSGVNVEKLSKQGVFADLSPYLEQSEKWGPSDFVDGILEAYTFDGVLVGIPEGFTMLTLVGDGTQTGGEGLSLDGLFQALSRNPGALPFEGSYNERLTREEVMQYLMIFGEDVFIDWDTGECRFDSETFQAVLELCSRYPDGDAAAVRNGSESEVSLPARLQSGQVLFALARMDDIKDFQLYKAIFGETAACVGFPTGDGKGGTLLYSDGAFGIFAGSENKDGAWKFVESIPDWKVREGMELQDVYLWYNIPDRFPALKSTLDMIIEYRTQEDQAWLERGHEDLGGRSYEDGWSFDYHMVTRDEIETILNLVKDATPAFDLENDEIIKIIREEAQGYYSGQKSAEDVAEVIQNRVRMYVEENR